MFMSQTLTHCAGAQQVDNALGVHLGDGRLDWYIGMEVESRDGDAPE
jgi:hypothetical protein